MRRTAREEWKRFHLLCRVCETEPWGLCPKRVKEEFSKYLQQGSDYLLVRAGGFPRRLKRAEWIRRTWHSGKYKPV